MGPVIRDIGAEDLPWVHALNRAHELELSPMTEAEMAAHLARADYARAAEGGAFLLAFGEAGDYSSPNFLWHRARFDRFLYVDRVATAATHRRRGLAAALYRDLIAFAGARGVPLIAAEINSDPPNPESDAFHARFGFETVGEAFLEGRGKTVRYIALRL